MHIFARGSGDVDGGVGRQWLSACGSKTELALITVASLMHWSESFCQSIFQSIRSLLEGGGGGLGGGEHCTSGVNSHMAAMLRLQL